MDEGRKANILAQLNEAVDSYDVIVDIHRPTVPIPSVDGTALGVEHAFAGVKMMVVIWPDPERANKP